MQSSKISHNELREHLDVSQKNGELIVRESCFGIDGCGCKLHGIGCKLESIC